MKILGALLVLVLGMGCGGSKGSGAAPPAEPAATPVEPAETAVPEAAAPAPETPPVAETPPAAEPPPAAPAEVAPAAAAASGMKLEVLPATWSKEQVKDYMKKVVATGLGVKCEFCHDVKDFAADTNKHKAIARGMMKMVNELNQKHFKGEPRLSCITCHDGKPEPKKLK